MARIFAVCQLSLVVLLLPVSSLVVPDRTSMTTTKLGSLQVPAVGIGTIAWSSKSLTRTENSEIDKLVQAATKRDSALFDTAERYGSNWKTALGVLGWGETESWLGRYSQASDNKMIVATKFTPSPWRTTVQSVVDACDASRKRLGVESIDLYQLHMPDLFVDKGNFSKNEIYWQGLAECYHRGWVKNVGVSNYGPTLLAQCQDYLGKQKGGVVPLASNQIAYSLLGRHNGAQETVDYCKDHDIAVLAYFPLAMGVLTGKYNGVIQNSPSQKSRLERNDLRFYSKQLDTFISVIQGIAENRGKTISQVALNYVICQGAIPIPGARTEAQVIDNMGAMGWSLTPLEIQTLETAASRIGFAGFEGAGFKRASEKFVGYGMEAWALD